MTGLLPLNAVEFESGDSLLFYGDSLPMRVLEEGAFEALLQAAQPDLNLTIRSFANTGDQVHWRLRPDGFTNHLKFLMEKWPANRVILCFGMNESFAGDAGLAKFEADLHGFLDSLQKRHPRGEFLLVSPTAAEDTGNPDLPHADERNADIERYAAIV
ncbi:MAG: hypothetical protein AAGJ31_13710, partial [Verrucomicrobiota bacterium]